MSKNLTVETTTSEQFGFDFAKGAMNYLCRCALWFIVLLFIFNLCRRQFNWGLDDSDKDGWTRSGLEVHTDYKTGIQYLVSPNGGIIQRGEKQP